jgi:hypothetical protein
MFDALCNRLFQPAQQRTILRFVIGGDTDGLAAVVQLPALLIGQDDADSCRTGVALGGAVDIEVGFAHRFLEQVGHGGVYPHIEQGRLVGLQGVWQACL